MCARTRPGIRRDRKARYGKVGSAISADVGSADYRDACVAHAKQRKKRILLYFVFQLMFILKMSNHLHKCMRNGCENKVNSTKIDQMKFQNNIKNIKTAKQKYVAFSFTVYAGKNKKKKNSGQT
ncbi:MAG: hypothetical protein GQ533_15340 [Methanosarcinaceae archaeon]|nr:hypothetical protein [Methanosarcinaceae archaeon]